MIAPARQAAYDALRAVTSRRADLPSALARVRTSLPDERDRALAGEIVTGTLRWMGAFDHVIEAFARRPVGKLDPEVVDVLRLTAFQLLHLDRVPASAAVNDAVNLVRKAGKKSASGLVNAVLRRISRERRTLPLPARPEEGGTRDAAIAYLATALSHPAWLAARWLDRYGFAAAEAWAQFDNAPAALTLRTNTLAANRDTLAAALAAEGVTTEPTRFAPDGLVVRSGNPLLTPLAGSGRFVVQDESSQLVALLVGARPGETVLDACASPGGKTTAMAAMMEDAGRLVALDVRSRRVALLARTVRESAASCVRLVQADVSRALPFRPAFDAVLLDAPCSGLGTLRRDPEIRWRRRLDELPRLAGVQRAMLREAARVVKPGGRLIYATCSSEPEENEEVVEAVLKEDASLQPAPAAAHPAALQRFVSDAGYFQTTPFRDGLEGFFAAMLVKTKDLR
ncbi:MAG: 16S rRNA (cytosine(967)-C(5))-methyltransferase RsmB [Acidobacteria bacterium]|nr:16S rRNA (cytosine(967)-C(5))-methyltransferase RsmB [Acidobacteriota bacterium]MBA3884616.1 16S rRNA (cytosine(967)-C(5))-methyltransferase RsmB [Acidobacteriota bacterium]